MNIDVLINDSWHNSKKRLSNIKNIHNKKDILLSEKRFKRTIEDQRIPFRRYHHREWCVFVLENNCWNPVKHRATVTFAIVLVVSFDYHRGSFHHIPWTVFQRFPVQNKKKKENNKINSFCSICIFQNVEHFLFRRIIIWIKEEFCFPSNQI